MQKLILVVALLVPGVVFAQAPVSKLGSGSVEERLQQLERVMDARNAAQMALLDQMSTLQDEVAQLRGRTEEHAYQLEQILQRQREIYQEIDRRLAATPEPATVTTPSNSVAGTSETSSNTNYSSNLGENDAYDKAIRLVMEDRRYDAAIPEFRSFIQQFPNSTYVPNAHYWLGQLLYAEGDFAEAKQEFTTVVEQYPDSNKRADSILKLGIVAQQQGEKQLARNYFDKVIADYPESTPADLAKKRLDNL
ncbi:Cell division coordinator CpoB [Pseudidiomarina piscicola]|uniref:Cell division coordinator CpoB n=1 Tax=Pseudidiomarina piscicola TaxID=2614830 RepID=A0A6S6WK13_9GAMM|nr:tol-pal system protein YbgF [Pseudidiomarina piscicola]CAB0149472.1 Cell division coordinator CpoB [Pseudidiomarina piscicola]VZT38917.1 Cell division coordinator CpoB [Pseudomonas aeruginosa]